MTVQELLLIPSLKGLKMIAGHAGAANRISTVSVMDAPDIYNWMKGGEFLITTAYSIKGDAAYLSTLMEHLKKSNIAAFGVKFSRFWGAIPQSAIDTANRLALPLISIPEQYAFTDIINPVLYGIVNQQTFELYQKDSLHKAFLNVVLNSSDTKDILNTLSGFLKSDVVFIDEYFHSMTTNDHGEQFVQQLSGVQEQYISYVVSNDQLRYGQLFIDADRATANLLPIHQTAIEYAGILLALNTQMKISNSRIEERYRNEFLSDLIHQNIKSEQELITRAKLYNWSFRDGGTIVIVDINNMKQLYVQHPDAWSSGDPEAIVDRISDIAMQEFSAAFRDVKYYKQSDFIIYLISTAAPERGTVEQKLRALFPKLQERVRRRTARSVTLGVGTYQENILEISKSYQDARFMIQLAQEMGMQDSVFFFEHMSTFRLLAAVSDPAIKKEFVERYLSPIIRYDAAHSSDLLRTLQEIVWAGWNQKAAAEALYIHYNSMKYRAAKIGELLELDLREHENQLNIELAVNLFLMDKNSRDFLS